MKMICNICPRKCNIDRSKTVGFCGAGDTVKVARAGLHFYEEPCISGQNGSGTVFFSGCNLKCVYCQNKSVSAGQGKEITVERLGSIFLELQNKGANNINLVTPDQYALQIKKAVKLAKNKGLKIPIVYNTSGYCSVETLVELSDVIDVFLTDFKYMNEEKAQKYSSAKDYPIVVKNALKQMYLQVGKPQYDENGIMKKGVIVRHLCLPQNSDDSKEIIKYLYQTYGDNIVVSIMNQYTPMGVCEFSELNRKLSDEEYDDVVDFAVDLGLENAYVQEGETADESFIPDFSSFYGV